MRHRNGQVRLVWRDFIDKLHSNSNLNLKDSIGVKVPRSADCMQRKRTKTVRKCDAVSGHVRNTFSLHAGASKGRTGKVDLMPSSMPRHLLEHMRSDPEHDFMLVLQRPFECRGKKAQIN